MAWRYRRRIRLARGLYLNLGKTGVTSISAGTRGARLTFGRRGKRATVGLPGSGISYTAYEPDRRSGAAPHFGRAAIAAIAIGAVVLIGMLLAGS